MTLHDEEPDFTTYSLSTLRDVEGWINRSKYPDRYERLRAEITRRAALPPEPVAPVESYEELDFPQSATHKRVAAFLIGGMAATNLLTTLFNVVTQTLDAVLAHPEVSSRLLVGSVGLLSLTLWAAVAFYRGERWSRYVLWPVAVLSVLSLDGDSVIGVYMLWVLWGSRMKSNAGASTAA